MHPTKYLLPDTSLPKCWYNLQADFKNPMPATLHPGTGNPVTEDDLAPLFARELIRQEMSTERWIEIPQEVRDVLKQWRCTPLYRARRLEQMLQTPAKIYYKHEGVSPVGSHKPNSAVPQVFYNKIEGIKRITTETGAGQWGASLAMACSFFDLECIIYMVRVSYDQKPYRRALMDVFGGKCIASPSELTAAGREILKKMPDTSGSLGMAISEAVEDALSRDDSHYCLGSVLNHVMLHQTVIGQEALIQMEMADDYPDVLVGCAGGGSNFAGLSFPFIGEHLRGGKKVRVLAVEPSACPSLTKGAYKYDFGDTAHLTPLCKMNTLGSTFTPPGLHAGGLRYHGMAPMVSHAMSEGLLEACSYNQLETFSAGIQFCRAEGILPAPESCHAVCAAIKEAERCREEGKSETILFNLSGHGHFDMGSYIKYMAGELQNYAYPEQEIAMALSGLPRFGNEE